ncbi:MAG: SDR family oxidoreductase [Clostridia bacterium]|nr:SDR family oxidoreductase [Clostridia bacterium]
MSNNKKIALITGASVGIGKATAIKLSEEGYDVVLMDINEERMSLTQAECEKLGARVRAYVCDVSNEEQVNSSVAAALEAFGSIDVLVNNAALWKISKSFLDTPIDQWKLFFDVNVMGVVYVTRAVLPNMIEKGYGRIVNVASVAGVYGNANMACYSASKGAIISLTKALAKEVAQSGVTVNSVSPGTVSDSLKDDLYHTVPNPLSYMGRSGSDMENAELICFLCGDKASYISGQNYQIDGCRKMI